MTNALREMIDAHTAALRTFERKESALASYDILVDRCKTEILEDIPKGLPLKCAHVRNSYVIDLNDYACLVSEHPDNDVTLMAFLNGHLSADDYRKWLDERLDEFADKYATERAEYIESAE